MSYTKERTITIAKKDVFFDIDYLSLLYSDVTAGNEPVKGNVIATETASANGRRILTRLCDNRMGDVRTLLRKFIKTATASAASDALVDTDWTMTLTVTTETEDNVLAVVADLTHDYLVSGGLADFYAEIGVAGNHESLNLRADADFARIKELIYYRPMP